MKLTKHVWLSVLFAVFLLAGGGPAAATNRLPRRIGEIFYASIACLVGTKPH
jgi:hypothetical protein